MNKVYSEFRRGDVWYVRLTDEIGDGNNKSSVQKKSRPYLIVSCEENNNCAPTINAVPITTRPADHLPMHVYFNYNNRDQLILCEQITTLSVLDFQRSDSHFMYCFNLEFMTKVDDALSAQLGLKPRVADMKVLENLIDKISSEREAELKRKYEDNLQMRVESIAAKLAKQFNINLDAQDMLTGATYRPEELTYASKEDKMNLTETAKSRMTPPVTSQSETKDSKTTPEKSDNSTDKPRKKSSKTQWTETAMKAYLSDYEHLSVSAISSKYGIAKKSVAQYRYLFRKKLDGQEGDND